MQLTYYNRIGEDKINKLVHDFYLEIRNDKILLPMYKDGLEAAEERLRLFMIQYLGGPSHYNEKRGHPRLKQRHVVFPVTEKAKQNWLANMKTALEKSDIGNSEKEFLWNYFCQTAEFLKNR